VITLICIPAYNEEKNISKFVTKCKQYSDMIVVCDDGSTDQTSHLAKLSGAKVISHKTNNGKGAALKSLFEYAKNIECDIVVTIDGDGQFLPEEIPKLLQKIQNDDSDIVIGSRLNTNSDMPLYRKIGNKFLDKMTNLAVDVSVSDTQSGFRAYSKKILHKIHFDADNFSADSEILVNAAKKNIRISEVPITVIYNTGGRTSTQNPISHFTSVFTNLLENIAIKSPLKYLGIPGLVFFIFGIVYALIVISIFNETRYFSIPSTLVSMSTLMIGLLLILMSILLYAINQTNKIRQ